MVDNIYFKILINFIKYFILIPIMIGLKGDILQMMVVSNLEVYIYGLDNIQGKMQMMMVITG